MRTEEGDKSAKHWVAARVELCQNGSSDSWTCSVLYALWAGPAPFILLAPFIGLWSTTYKTKLVKKCVREIMALSDKRSSILLVVAVLLVSCSALTLLVTIVSILKTSFQRFKLKQLQESMLNGLRIQSLEKICW